ncbi:MAG: hypothetical protein PHD97_13135 [Bacteroidales bacterium]|jgi:hypothetical protein|nr:hypothetical protein [Bacteroidales bacterium]
MENERLPKWWWEIANEDFARILFAYPMKKHKIMQFLYDENGKELENPLLFTIIWEIDLPNFEGLGIAMSWTEFMELKYFQFGNIIKWENEKSLLISQVLNE